jgi:branched-chain amino acid transport system ATP-binding protein
VTQLEVTGGYAGYDTRRSVVKDVSLRVDDGDFVTILGANGAGKSTLIRGIMGLCHWHAGSVAVDNRDISRYSARRRAGLGMAVVPQGQELFAGLSVMDNLRAGGLARRRRETMSGIATVLEAFPRLAERREQRVSTLSGGERALVALGRALVSKPSLLLLDEPSLGLSPGTRAGVFSYLRSLCDQFGLTVVLAEQDAANALLVARTCYGMRNGRTLGCLPADRVHREELRNLYLGSGRGGWSDAGLPTRHPSLPERELASGDTSAASQSALATPSSGSDGDDGGRR